MTRKDAICAALKSYPCIDVIADPEFDQVYESIAETVEAALQQWETVTWQMVVQRDLVFHVIDEGPCPQAMLVAQGGFRRHAGVCEFCELAERYRDACGFGGDTNG